MGGLNDGQVVEAKSSRARLDSIDLLRGLVMVIMALDHVRDYFHGALFTLKPIDPTSLQATATVEATTTAIFLTRWITHFCAPTFVFLAGTGAFLAGSRGKSTRELSWFLLSRGLWLVLLDTTLVRLGWNFNLDYFREFGGGVIWAIGWSMVAMAGLVFLPLAAIATVGVLLIAFHNLLDGLTAAELGLPQLFWALLHRPEQLAIVESLHPRLQEWLLGHWPDLARLKFVSGYSILPWLGVVAAGYGFGALFLLDRPQRRRQLIGLGIVLTLAFVVLRAGNLYGDPPPSPQSGANMGRWSMQSDWRLTVFSFVNCNKYPPSLLFLLMTLGPAITALGLFDRDWGRFGRFFITFGRVPLFYYLLHIPLIHGVMVGLDYLRFGWSPYAHTAPWNIREQQLPVNYGYSLSVVYLVWIGVVLALYPLCWWYGQFKRSHKAAWLSYL